MNIIDSLKTSLWPQQIAAFLTIIGIPIFLLKFVFYKARHKIYFDAKETYHEVKLLDHPNQPQSFWLHLMVKNNGYELSKNTEAYLSEIWIRDNYYIKIEDFRAPVKLKWAHEEDIYPIDILPKEKRRLDICYICENEKILHLMSKGFPSGSIKNKLIPGDYVFIIKVVSENSLTPAEFYFKVEWDGTWRNIKGSKYVKSFSLYDGGPLKSFHLV